MDVKKIHALKDKVCSLESLRQWMWWMFLAWQILSALWAIKHYQMFIDVFHATLHLME